MVESAEIVNTALQQFVTQRNDDMAIDGEIGDLRGNSRVTFYETNLLQAHTAGTASEDGSLEITSLADNTAVFPGTTNTVNTTSLVLQGLTAGATIVQDDLLDIGVANGLQYLTYVGHIASSNTNVQCRVITGGTADGGGNITITVYPRLVYDGTNVDPQRNLPRAIVNGASGDKVRIAKSHIPGFIFLEDYLKFACPNLPTKSPYATASVMDPDTKIGMRAYHGAVFDQPITQMVLDVLYGAGGAPEGCARILFPLEAA